MTTREHLQQSHKLSVMDTDHLTQCLTAWTTLSTRKQVEKIFFEMWKSVPENRIVNDKYITVVDVAFKAVAEYNRRRTFKRLGWGKTPFEVYGEWRWV